MHLSDIEMKMVAQIRKQEASLVRLRWFVLLTGVVVLGVVGYCLLGLLRFLDKPDLDSVLTVACFMPLIYLFAALGAGIVGYIAICWNGRPERRLLLRVIDESQKHDT